MTIEEALKIIKEFINGTCLHLVDQEALETLIPELAESEDEKIRKGLIEALKTSKTVGELKFILPEPTREECIAYLEKLKGKMTAEEFESSELFQLKLKTKYANGYQDGLAQKEQKEIPLMNGDADLYFDNWIQYNDTTKRGCFEEGIRYAQRLQKEQKPLSTEETELNSIAFLEQMGYTCIPPKKEHQNNSDAPKNALGGALNSPLDKDKNLDEIAQDYVDGVKEYNSEPTWDLVQTAVCYGYHYREQEEHSMSAEEEWSEEDERIIDTIVSVLGQYIDYKAVSGTGSGYATPRYSKEIDWLKSLRPPQDRCKDCPHRGDMFLLTQGVKSGKHDLAIKFMNYLDENRPEDKMSLSNGECEDIDKAFKEGDWAKIIRYVDKYHPHWKPSEEQMNALNFAITYFMHETSYKNPTELRDLYNQLKKL